MIPCESGLFIGVNRYEFLEEENVLLSSSAGAIKLLNYFEAVDPSGNWQLLIENPTTVSNRNEILITITKWLQRINEKTAGLLYFGGHGIVADEGMILCPTDYSPFIPYDSGIPLNRLIQIIQKLGNRDAYYILIVDACRNTLSTSANPDLVPPNVCILYSCQIGSEAQEVFGESIFISALFKAIEETPKTKYINKAAINFQRLISNILKQIEILPKPKKQSIDFFGSNAEKLLIPWLKNSFTYTKAKDKIPDCYLLTKPINNVELLSNHKTNLINSMKSWVGYDLSPEGFLGEVAVITKNQFEPYLSLKLPAGSHTSDGFLTHFLAMFPSLFYCLRMEWQNRFSHARIKMVIRQFNLDSIALTDKNYVLSWQNTKYKGIMLINYQKESNPIIEIFCRTIDDMPYDIGCILPELEKIYNQLLLILN